MNVLKTGDKFMAKTKLGDVNEYEFVGVDMDDCDHGTGCHYIVLKNLTDRTMTCVERTWFAQQLTGRKIKRLEG